MEMVTERAFANIYGDHDDSKKIIKYECIGHYQKRVSNRLRKLCTELKLGGKNRLTNQKIDTLQKLLWDYTQTKYWRP